MRGIRKVNNDTLPKEDVDVEAPKDKDSSKICTAFAAASTSDSFSPPSGSGHNPIFLAKVIVRKVVALLTEDEEDITQPGGIISVLKDIVLGVVLGILFISVLIFLDHRDIIHLQSAHNFRDAAFQLLSDPETIANLEEATDFKFITIADYESKHKEIDGVAEKTKSHEQMIEKRTKELEEKKKEVDAIKEEYNTLMNNELLGINKYCGGCPWSGKTTCDARVAFLQQKYSTRPIAAKVSAMEHPSCKKK